MEQIFAFDRECIQEEQTAFTQEITRLIASDPAIVFYTISPVRDTAWREKGMKDRVEVIRGFPVSGQTELNSLEERKEIADALLKGLLDARTDIIIPSCFLPHHALTISKGEKKVDLIICFKCAGIEAHGAYTGSSFSISEKIAPMFEAVANNHALKTAP